MSHAPSPLRGSRGRTVARLPVRLFGFRGREASPRPVGAGIACQYHAQACSLGVSDVPQASPSRHLRCVPCAKPRHGSTRGLAGLPSFPTAPLHYREPLCGRYRFVPTVENWRDRMKPAAPKCQTGKTSRRRTLTALASQRPERRPGLRPGRLRCQSGRTSALRASRGSNGSEIRRSR